MQDVNELRNVAAEAGIISTLIHYPDYIFQSDMLQPRCFFENDNGLIYYAISQLIKIDNVKTIDAYNIMMVLNKSKATENPKTITVESLNSFIENSSSLMRNSPEEYKLLADTVIDLYNRRKTYTELRNCENLLFDDKIENVALEISNRIDNVANESFNIDKMEPFNHKIDSLWTEIQERSSDGSFCGIPSSISPLNKYFTYEKGELILVCGKRKEGKSMFAVTEALDCAKRGLSVVHFDTEMSDRQILERLLANLSQVPVRLIKSGKYNEQQKKQIEDAKNWLKDSNYEHIYIPNPDMNTLYAYVKRAKMKNKIDFLIYDYIKSQDLTSSSEIYNQLGNTINFLKNRVAGELDLPILALAQLNRSEDIQDSFKLEQIASTVCVVKRKKMEEYVQDGEKCGNYKFFVKLNRLGEQMDDINTEYIDLAFNGDVALFKEAPEQHSVNAEEPM